MKHLAFILLLVMSSLTYAGQKKSTEISYMDDIKPILDNRCVQCHGCYNAPCQLKLTSYKGFKRGLNHVNKIYAPERILKGYFTDPDVSRPEDEYENIGFSPIAEMRVKDQSNLDSSYIWKLINQRKDNNSYVLKASEESSSCPSTSFKLESHLAKNQNMGMPYGLPPLEDSQIEKMEKWVLAGSPGPTADEEKKIKAVSDFAQDKVDEFESYLNQKGLKRKLVSRYLFEHLFLSRIYFESPVNGKAPDFFRIVRSKAKCSENGDDFVSRHPWDLKEPKSRVLLERKGESNKYTENDLSYCIRKSTSTIVHKNHLTYDMRDVIVGSKKVSKLDRIKFLFSDKNIKNITKLPSRNNKEASNPFKTFQSISAKSRYQFLLDNANYFIRTFIRGPVCKGSVALNSINDRFWAFFTDPNKDPLVLSDELGDFLANNHKLPAKDGSGTWTFSAFFSLFKGKYYKDYDSYRELKLQLFGNPNKELSKNKDDWFFRDQIWNGTDSFSKNYRANKNPEALQTIFRHEDSASAHTGLVGAPSKTVFVIDYSIFERLYYSLVAGYDVFGDLGHQLRSRDYMGVLRTDAEANFLSFLPENTRDKIKTYWFREKKTDPNNRMKNRIRKQLYQKNELATNMQFHVLANTHNLEVAEKAALKNYKLGSEYLEQNQFKWVSKPITNQKEVFKALKSLELREQRNAGYVKYFPSLTYVLVRASKQNGGNKVYTMVKTNAHFNAESIFAEVKHRDFESDHLIISDEFIGSYPNFYVDIDLKNAQMFIQNLHDHAGKDIDELSINKFKRHFGRFGSPYPKTEPTIEYGSYKNSEAATSEILKNSYAKFWDTNDEINRIFKQENPIEAGILDLNRYEAKD